MTSNLWSMYISVRICVDLIDIFFCSSCWLYMRIACKKFLKNKIKRWCEYSFALKRGVLSSCYTSFRILILHQCEIHFIHPLPPHASRFGYILFSVVCPGRSQPSVWGFNRTPFREKYCYLYIMKIILLYIYIK